MGLTATPTENPLALRVGDFASLAEALDYAAQGQTGCNFYNGRGRLYAVLPYKQLRAQAIDLALRLDGLRLERGARVAIVADTGPEFLRTFFACQYAGLVPVPLPIPIHLASHTSYVDQLRHLLASCRVSVGVAPEPLVPLLAEAAAGMETVFLGSSEELAQLPPAAGADAARLRPSGSDETAYIQYTSGSTRFPRGVVVKQRALMNNLTGSIRDGLQVRPGDRCVSWLPYYHDMGLVGFVLGPVASQLSVDYLSTRDFAMRPRQWLTLLSNSRGTISFSPSFGYELCARRLRKEDADTFDLRAWRVAGVGAEKIRPEPLESFAAALAGSGFDADAFQACYGMAECALAVSFAPLSQGLNLDRVDAEHLAQRREAIPLAAAEEGSRRASEFVDCGIPLGDFQVEVRDQDGEVLPERRCGIIHLRGPSVMAGYFENAEATAEALSPDGWLNTGDKGYRVGDRLVITGRAKDLIIINGRNLWPQDLEYLAEQQPGVRPGDASAFSIPGEREEEMAIMVVQCRESDAAKRSALVHGLRGAIREELGIDCFIELVPPRTLPRTSSGKLSRSRTKQDFLRRVETGKVRLPGPAEEERAPVAASA
jgi:fatty-acyl-CoA synthase